MIHYLLQGLTLRHDTQIQHHRVTFFALIFIECMISHTNNNGLSQGCEFVLLYHQELNNNFMIAHIDCDEIPYNA